MTRYDNTRRRAPSPTAAERRRLRIDGGPLFQQIALAEQRLFEEQRELYELLAKMTPEELETLARGRRRRGGKKD